MDAAVSAGLALKQAIRGHPLKSMELRWVKKRQDISKSSNSIPRHLRTALTTSPSPSTVIPVWVSAQRRDINPEQVGHLYGDCNHSCQRFPNMDPNSGTVKEVLNLDKLRIALSHSAVLVSVFCNSHQIQLLDSTYPDNVSDILSSSLLDQEIPYNRCPTFGNWLLQQVMPLTPSNGKLVGFGRAVSDIGLTASIYDVMVIPSLRRMGIGKLIVNKIIRTLTSRDIYDTAALCSDQERLFFEACDFGDDTLGSTTMMYARSLPNSSQGGDQFVRQAGRKLLVAPPLCMPFSSTE